MNGYDLDSIARRVIERAARRAPATLSERLQEEWLADLSDHHGPIARLGLALGCYWAATRIRDECFAMSTPAVASSAAGIALAGVPHGMAVFPRQPSGSDGKPALCEINTTPLIDVLLVLIVTLIITLPLMTQAVRIDLPRSATTPYYTPPEVINLDIDFDGTILWNGSPVANLEQLDGYFRAESQKVPQPEIHLRPDAHVKYDVVAKVLAAAQRNQLTKLGIVNNGEFAY